jgi:hypothetical protein
MARDQTSRSEQSIKKARLSGETALDLRNIILTELPESLGQLTQLRELKLGGNQLTVLPPWLANLKRLEVLWLGDNRFREVPPVIVDLPALSELALGANRFSDLPAWLGELKNLRVLWHGYKGFLLELTRMPECIRSLRNLTTLAVSFTRLEVVPGWIDELEQLKELRLNDNRITDLPASVDKLPNLRSLLLDANPLNPELSAAYINGLDDVKRYLRAKAEAQVVLNEAKLVFVGEGGVGKSSLLGALRGEAWEEKRESTHGVETKVLQVSKSHDRTQINLNAWDFGGQPIYRPTHQLFFTAPAIYLAVWDPRRGPEQCCVDEWIQMVKHRTYDEKRPEQWPRVLVVATNGGPKERRDHIDEQGLRKQFGGMIVSFHHVDSHTGYGLADLTKSIAASAEQMPNVGRSVAASWKRVLDAVRDRGERDPYISYDQFEVLCATQRVGADLAATYAAMLNELGYLIHYSGDSGLKDTVILKADWLSKAISFVLEDQTVKDQSGLVDHKRLGELWNDPDRPVSEQYPVDIHPVFLRLMERFELTYRVNLPEQNNSEASNGSILASGTSLVAQLVPGARPDSLMTAWPTEVYEDDTERVQICRIADKLTGQPAAAGGLLYRLIVRLHRYSLGRTNYSLSCHWQKGLVIDDGYNGRALLEEIGGDVRVTVRAAYPERLLHHLCEEVKWLVNNFWKGLNCQITVPCLPPCKASLEVEALIQSRRERRPEYPCPVCRRWLKIDSLLTTAPPMPETMVALAEIKRGQAEILEAVDTNYESLSTQLRTLLSQTDEKIAGLIRAFADEAKEGPRLFSLYPVERSNFNPKGWVKRRFRVTLWCEHTRLPLPLLNNNDSEGVYEFEISREWFAKAAPFLKILAGTLILILPVAASTTKLVLDEGTYKNLENQLDFGKECAEAMLDVANKTSDWMADKDGPEVDRSGMLRTQGGVLREFQTWLKKEDPSFGDLRRVLNKRQEFLWVHRDYESQY